MPGCYTSLNDLSCLFDMPHDLHTSLMRRATASRSALAFPSKSSAMLMSDRISSTARLYVKCAYLCMHFRRHDEVHRQAVCHAQTSPHTSSPSHPEIHPHCLFSNCLLLNGAQVVLQGSAPNYQGKPAQGIRLLGRSSAPFQNAACLGTAC